MNTKYIWLASIIIGLTSCFMCKAQLDYGMVPTNSNWHIITNSLTPEFEDQIIKQNHIPSNSVLWMKGFRNGIAWTTNTEEFWHGIWVEGTNGMRTQLVIVTNATNCLIRVQAGSFTLKREPGSQCFGTPNGKFAKFDLADANGRIVLPKPTAGTNLIDGAGTYYQTNLSSWAAPSAGSLVANFPGKVSTNIWPLYYVNGGLAPIAHLSGHGIAEQLCSLNLYDFYSITNAGVYTLTVQPVLYMQKSYNSEFLDRVDLPCVTTKVHLVPNVK